MIGSLISSW